MPMVSAGHRSGYRNFLSVPSCTCMAILSILMKSRCHRFSSHIISVFIGCALWKIEIIKQTELLRYALPFQVISGGWCSDEVLVLITECTLWRRGSTEANVRRHNGFYTTPRKHSAQSADSRAWGFTVQIKIQRSFRLVNCGVEINDH